MKYDYDLLVIAGPVFPHEVIGFSGGNKYIFPGISGPDVLHFFHWLGAVIFQDRAATKLGQDLSGRARLGAQPDAVRVDAIAGGHAGLGRSAGRLGVRLTVIIKVVI